jgi:hypothetical protein
MTWGIMKRCRSRLLQPGPWLDQKRALKAAAGSGTDYTAWDLEPQDCGWSGPLGRERFLLRCEPPFSTASREERLAPSRRRQRQPGAKASFPTPRDAVKANHGHLPHLAAGRGEVRRDYRTKRVILDIYDAMQESIAPASPPGARSAAGHLKANGHSWTTPRSPTTPPQSISSINQYRS